MKITQVDKTAELGMQCRLLYWLHVDNMAASNWLKFKMTHHWLTQKHGGSVPQKDSLGTPHPPSKSVRNSNSKTVQNESVRNTI